MAYLENSSLCQSHNSHISLILHCLQYYQFNCEIHFIRLCIQCNDDMKFGWVAELICGAFQIDNLYYWPLCRVPLNKLNILSMQYVSDGIFKKKTSIYFTVHLQEIKKIFKVLITAQNHSPLSKIFMAYCAIFRYSRLKSTRTLEFEICNCKRSFQRYFLWL